MDMTSIQEETLKGYPGAALIIKADGTIEKTNDKGTAFSSLTCFEFFFYPVR